MPDVPKSRPSPGTVAALVVLVALLLAWAVWAGLGAAKRAPLAEVTGFRIPSDSRIDVRVASGPGADGPVVCTVRALDETRGEVGVAGVRLDPRQRTTAERWVTVRTRGEAVTGVLGRCAERAE